MKIPRFLAWPISSLYGLGVRMRNSLYDRDIYKSIEFTVPSIVIGNLAMGGTGKTPMTEYIIELFSDSQKMAVISRGYRRRTKGFVLADAESTALTIGDEPMQIKMKYPQVEVAVGEERAIALTELVSSVPDVELVLFDDAFQHRSITSDCAILLSTYQRPFFKDDFFPMGYLRDGKEQSKRADVIVFTKSPEAINEKEFLRGFVPEKEQAVFFSHLEYAPAKSWNSDSSHSWSSADRVLLFTGIANSAHLQGYLKSKVAKVEEMKFPDHYQFDERDLDSINKKFKAGEFTALCCSEKDAVRLLPFDQKIGELSWPLYVQPVKMSMHPDEELRFRNILVGKIADKEN